MKTLDSIISGRRLYAILKDWTVSEAAQYMTEKRVGAVAVVDGEHLVGVFSERDLMTRVVVPGRPPDRTYVADVMTSQVVACTPEDTHDEGMRQMQQAGCRHLPVVRGSRLVGFVSLRDLLQVEIDEKGEELRHINAYVNSTGY